MEKKSKIEVNIISKHVKSDENNLIILRWKEYQLLRLLCLRAPMLVTRGEIINTIWNDTYCNEGTINQTIRTLRRKINDKKKQKIITIPRGGYIINKDHITTCYDLMAVNFNKNEKSPYCKNAYREKNKYNNDREKKEEEIDIIPKKIYCKFIDSTQKEEKEHTSIIKKTAAIVSFIHHRARCFFSKKIN